MPRPCGHPSRVQAAKVQCILAALARLRCLHGASPACLLRIQIEESARRHGAERALVGVVALHRVGSGLLRRVALRFSRLHHTLLIRDETTLHRARHGLHDLLLYGVQAVAGQAVAVGAGAALVVEVEGGKAQAGVGGLGLVHQGGGHGGGVLVPEHFGVVVATAHQQRHARGVAAQIVGQENLPQGILRVARRRWRSGGEIGCGAINGRGAVGVGEHVGHILRAVGGADEVVGRIEAQRAERPAFAQAIQRSVAGGRRLKDGGVRNLSGLHQLAKARKAHGAGEQGRRVRIKRVEHGGKIDLRRPRGQMGVRVGDQRQVGGAANVGMSEHDFIADGEHAVRPGHRRARRGRAALRIELGQCGHRHEAALRIAGDEQLAVVAHGQVQLHQCLPRGREAVDHVLRLLLFIEIRRVGQGRGVVTGVVGRNDDVALRGEDHGHA